MSVYKYQNEYENSSCFWGTDPAKFVKLYLEKFSANLENKLVLDIGAGEGKNSVYLANMGAKVVATDVSKLALSRFTMQPNYHKCKSQIYRVISDIKNLAISKCQFDIIVAYGVLHCLDNRQEIYNAIDQIKNMTRTGGINIISTFTNKVPIPDFQDYLNVESLMNVGELESRYAGWEILLVDNDEITETHPTSSIEHKHSLVRLISSKILS